MLKEALESLRINWISRASSPLFGALVTSWTVWNHRLLFVLLSDKSIAWRFNYIDNRLYPTAQDFLIYHVVGPILSAALYLYVFPYPARAVFRYTLKRKKELNDISLAIEGQQLLTLEEAQLLRKEMANAEAQRQEEREKHKSEMEQVAKANASLAERFNAAQLAEIQAEAQTLQARPDLAKARVTKYLLSRPFLFIFNPKISRDEGSRTMMFASSGEIEMGKDADSAHWDVTPTGELHFFDENGKLSARFTLDPKNAAFNGYKEKNGWPMGVYPASPGR